MRLPYALIAAVLLAGCGGPGALIDTTPLEVSQKLPPIAQQAQRAINEANGWLAGAAVVARQQQDAGIITSAEALEYKAKFRRNAEELDRLQKFIDDCGTSAAACGLVVDAEAKAKLLNTAMQALHKEIANRRRQR